MRKFFFFILCIVSLMAEEYKDLQFKGVATTYTDHNNTKINIIIKREKDSICNKIAIIPDNFWSDNYASKDIPAVCKKEFITTRGAVQPMGIDGIKTVGEIEILKFIKEKYNTNPNKYALIDTRGANWYEQLTIPTAINIPYSSLIKEEFLEDEYYKALKDLNIKIIDEKKNKFDFKNAKEIIVFCNGIWCPQSHRFIENAIKLGYPKDKIKWYRGGINDWLGVSFTTVKPKGL